MMNDKKIDGHAIREKRMNERLSASQLAKKIGVTNGKIYKWEGGTRPQTVEDYKIITDWLNDKVIKPSNGTVPSEDYKKKYYDLLEKYIALLEKISRVSA